MLTFDDINRKPANPLKELVKKTTPDQVECGENNEHWVFVRRSTKQIELVSKVTGLITAKCEIHNAAYMHKLTPAQISAAKAGLLL